MRLLPGETVHLACGVRQVKELEQTPMEILRRKKADVAGVLEVWPRTPSGESAMDKFLSKPTDAPEPEEDSSG